MIPLGVLASATPRGAPVPGVLFESEVLADSPWLYWRLGEAAPGPVLDSSGNGRTGVTGGSGVITYGVPGLVGDANTAYQITSSTNFLFSSTSFVAPVANFTLACAVKIDPGAPAGHILGFYQNSNPSPSSGSRDRFLYVNSSGQLVAGVWTGDRSIIVSPNPITDGQRHVIHFACGANAAAGSELYIDGVSVGTMPVISTDTSNGGVRYLIAGRNNLAGWPGGADASMLGVIDEVAYFHSRLSSARILAHAQAAGLA